jgi:8-oxo-dGTP pyrophosphatase MutT (NUDIX family)
MTPPSWEQIRSVLTSRPSTRVPDAVSARAAVAMILRDGDDGIELLFIRRAEHPRDPWSGQMGFPGGRREQGDADLRATAVRETAEEIGVDLSARADYLGALDELRAMARMRPMDLAITPFVFRLRDEVEPVLSDEVRSVHWLRLAALCGSEARSTTEYVHQGAALQFPCLRVDELVIWGLTYRMFTSFLELLTPGAARGGATTAGGPLP